MKKTTLLLMMMFVSLIYAQPNTNPTAPQARDAENVISIYGGGDNGNPYANITGVNFTPNWGQPGSYVTPDPAFDVNGNSVLYYEGLSYQGTDFAGNAQNAADMEFLHVDVWSPIDDVIRITPINNGTGAIEFYVDVSVTAGEWTTVDLPKADFTGMTWDSVFQLKVEKLGWGTPAPRGDFYLDNIYFWKNAVNPLEDATLSDLQVENVTVAGFASSTTDYEFGVAPGTTTVPQITSAPTTNANATTVITQATAIPGDATVVVTAEDGTTTETYTVSIVEQGPPTAAPTPPALASNQVVSIYSDAYTQQPLNFDVDFCGTNSTEELQIGGNNTILYKNNNCQGIVLDTPVDVTSFTTLNFDFYIEDGVDLVGKVLSVKLNQTNGNTDPNDDVFLDTALNQASNPPLETGQWVTAQVLVDLSGFTALDEIVITAGTLSNNLYYDNVYLSGGTLSNDSFSQAEFRAYPNPTQDVWNIRTSENIQKVEVYNITGRLVKEVNVNASEASINASELSTGVYLAKISNEFDQTRTIKLIKE